MKAAWSVVRGPWSVALAVAVLLAGTAAWALGPPKPAAPSRRPAADDAADLVFLAESGPVFLRLHVHVDGKSFRSAWNEYLRRLFLYLDRDGDGILNKEEVARTPKSQYLLQHLQGTFGFPSEGVTADIAEVDTRPKDGKVTREELGHYYRRTGFGPLRVGLHPDQGTSGHLTDGLFRVLDRDGDGRLAKEELAGAPAALARLDLDENEFVSAEEVAPQAAAGTTFYLRQATTAAEALADAGVLPLDEDEAAEAVARRVLTRYDRDRDGKLSAAEVGWDADLHRRFDADRDGRLSVAELARRWAGRPDGEFIVRLDGSPDSQIQRNPVAGLLRELGVKGAARRAVEAYSPQGPKTPLAGAAREVPTGLLLPLDSTNLSLVRAGWSEGVRAGGFNRRFLLQQFRMARAAGREYVERSGGMRPDFLGGLFDLADRDGDGKLYEKELHAYADVQSWGMACFCSLTFTDHGPGLFELLDADRDRHLGLRELRGGWEKVAAHDRDGDGRLARAEPPRRVEARFRTAEYYFGGQFTNPREPARAGGGGPAWFRKMDRNGDGDVSPREFLGLAEDFRRADADGDGLLDAREAAALATPAGEAAGKR